MDDRFLWLEGRKTTKGKSTRRKPTTKSAKKPNSKVNARKQLVSSGKRKEMKSRDFFAMLSNMLRLRIFNATERWRYDAHRYN